MGQLLNNTTIYILKKLNNSAQSKWSNPKKVIDANLLHAIPLHGVVLQSVASVLSPSHSFPPLRGTGALHSLVLTFRPPPQLAEH